jgi:prepilin-type N-terminal cleavage/methylation domain-containing protein
LKRAFTLVELLVVIGIIGAVAAILFPVLSSAKRAAREVQTKSNLHQIHVQTALYQTDHDGDGALGDVYRMGLPPSPQTDRIPLLATLLPPLQHPDAKIVGRQYYPIYAEAQYDGLVPSWSSYCQSEGANSVLYVDPHFTDQSIPLTIGNKFKRKFFFVRLSGSIGRVEKRGVWLSRYFWQSD